MNNSNEDLKKENVVEAKDMTIVEALDAIISCSCHSSLESEALDKASDSFCFLTEKLSVTKMQALIIAMLIDANESLQSKNMANYLGVSNISFLKYTADLENLVERKIIRKQIERGDKSPSYEIRRSAQQQYMKNEVYVAPALNNLSLADFINHANELFEDCNEEKMSRNELQQEIEELVALNMQLMICKSVSDLHIYDKIFFLYCVAKYSLENDCAINPMEITEYCNPLATRRMATVLENGKSELRLRNLIQSSGCEGFNGQGIYCISDKVKNEINQILGLVVEVDESAQTRGLLRYENITPKPLFYNQEEGNSMAELSEILSVEKFAGVQQRLEENGMRKGFACLFYGGPGTGKTESVLQLARNTGRHIMEVNIASIKSKWVGDSEKNIKNVFERYRHYCDTCQVTPILFFNEADAIISKRGTNVERSVDKMENAIQNIILEEMEKLEGILIATTNLTSNMDAAFERRFLYKVEFKKPGVEAKCNIWKTMLNRLTDDEAWKLAEKYEFSGGQIENVTRKVIINNILHDAPITLSKIQTYCDNETLAKPKAEMHKIGFR